MRLVTIPQSHYAEKARWALDLTGIAYVEQPHAPIFHLLATVPRGGRSVPVLIGHAGSFVDSTEILMHLDEVAGAGILYPTDAALRRSVVELEERFDEGLGPHTRRWGYFQLLPHARLVRSIMARGVPGPERFLLPAAFPLIRLVIRTVLRITPEGAARSLERIRTTFQEVGELLKDGRRYLVGDRLTAADIAFASLAAPTLFPPGYRGALPPLEALPQATRDQVQWFRATPAGAYALRLFAQERGK